MLYINIYIYLYICIYFLFISVLYIYIYIDILIVYLFFWATQPNLVWLGVGGSLASITLLIHLSGAQDKLFARRDKTVAPSMRDEARRFCRTEQETVALVAAQVAHSLPLTRSKQTFCLVRNRLDSSHSPIYKYTKYI